MPSGRRKRYADSNILFFAAAMTVAALPFSASCRSQAGFAAVLAAMDQAPPGGNQDARFEPAASKASTSGEWLRLLKRAWIVARSAPDGSDAWIRLAHLADRAIVRHPESVPLAKIAARAFMSAGDPGRAANLFPASLTPADNRDLFAECLVAAAKAWPDPVAGAGIGDLLVAHSASGDPGFLVDAALLALLDSDLPAAKTYGAAAVKAGFPMDPEMAWDLGLTDAILGAPDADSLSRIIRKADSYRMTGDRRNAIAAYKRAIALFPAASWIPYAALGALEDDASAAAAWIGRMIPAFRGDRQAVRAAIAIYASRNMMAEAEALTGFLDPRTPEDAAVLLAIADRSQSRERVGSEALRFAERFPSEPASIDYACAMLERLGRFEDAVERFRVASKAGARPARGYFHESIADILSGEIQAAIEAMERGGAADGGFTPVYDLGLLYLESGDSAKAAERFRIAVTYAGTQRSRAEAFVALGKAERQRGKSGDARAAFKAALQADPDFAEASFLLAE